MRYKRISADCHLDLIWLPPDLFVSEAPHELKDRMPYANGAEDAGESGFVAAAGPGTLSVDGRRALAQARRAGPSRRGGPGYRSPR